MIVSMAGGFSPNQRKKKRCKSFESIHKKGGTVIDYGSSTGKRRSKIRTRRIKVMSWFLIISGQLVLVRTKGCLNQGDKKNIQRNFFIYIRLFLWQNTSLLSHVKRGRKGRQSSLFRLQ